MKRLFFFCCVFITSQVQAQVSKISADSLGKTEVMEVFHMFPLLRDESGLYPGEIAVEGTVTEVTGGTSCGVVCGCGTLKLHLSKAVEGFKDEDVFVAVGCFTNADDYLHKKVKIKLQLLRKENDDCYWRELVMNFIDSKGKPFYIPQENEHLVIVG